MEVKPLQLDAIATSVNLKNATAILNFGKIPLQLYIRLIDAITPIYAIYTSHYTSDA
jgi:hypothetical protein